MEVQFLGAARTVTGSMHLVVTPRARVLLDCGLFQGPRREATQRNRHLPFSPREVDSVVLSHAHIDHSGVLPVLPGAGFGGTIYATPATRDLCAVMLEDAAMIQAADARYVNRLIERGELDSDPVEPLYTPEDVARTLALTVSVPYRRSIQVADGVRATFYDAGHVLGSAIVALDVEEAGTTKRLVFSGDLGRPGMPILRDPEVPGGAHALLLESTYGDRVHPARVETRARLAEVITRTIGRAGRVIIPTFALERAQELIITLKQLFEERACPRVPIYVDSPLTVKVTEVFRLHPDCYDAETRAMLDSDDTPFDIPQLTYISSVEDSKALSSSDDPCIILSASGMCESGRVLHHLRTGVENERNAVVIVGFQAPHTLGRRLVERRSRVRIFGVERERRAEVVVLEGLSAHADRDDLVRFASAVQASGDLRSIALVHGEYQAQRALEKRLRDALGIDDIRVPESGDALTV